VQRGREPSRWTLAAACGVAALAFGLFMDLYQWSFAAEQSAGTYGAVAGTSLAYNVAHVLASIAFALVVGPTFVRAIRRYQRRFEVRWDPPPDAGPLPTPVR